MRRLFVPDTPVKQELYLLVQGSVFAFGEHDYSCLKTGRYS
jgi:hypothetical protein